MNYMLASIFFGLLSIWAAKPAWASFIDTPSYRQCAALASVNPQKGIAFANDMLAGGSDAIASFHCRAMAYYTMGKYKDAAKDLARIYAKADKSQLALRSYITRQAARALAKAGDTDRALASLKREFMAIQELDTASDTLKERLGGDLLLDRAQLYADADQPTLAIQELDHAAFLIPDSDRILLARARMLTTLGAHAQAMQDLEKILEKNPRHAEARSMLKALRNP